MWWKQCGDKDSKYYTQKSLWFQKDITWKYKSNTSNTYPFLFCLLQNKKYCRTHYSFENKYYNQITKKMLVISYQFNIFLWLFEFLLFSLNSLFRLFYTVAGQWRNFLMWCNHSCTLLFDRDWVGFNIKHIGIPIFFYNFAMTMQDRNKKVFSMQECYLMVVAVSYTTSCSQLYVALTGLYR